MAQHPFCECPACVAPHTRCVDWNDEERALRFFAWASHLTRGAWIEISEPTKSFRENACRTSHEVRGLKCDIICLADKRCRSRTSHEVRGLKFNARRDAYYMSMSHLTRGAWIEMTQAIKDGYLCKVAPHTRCVDWNGDIYGLVVAEWESHLTRGAWIEIFQHSSTIADPLVAPHTRCVDWNSVFMLSPAQHL